MTEDGEKITLMTVHSAKGLEFRNVFVVGMEENLFPSGMVGNSPRALEEERRLFYVAITRAEDNCFLSFSKTRFRYGKMEFGSPSRFLTDIDTCFLRMPHDATIARKVDAESQRFRTERREPTRQLINEPVEGRNFKRVNSLSSPAGAASAKGGASAANVSVGQVIEHERFGQGEVMNIEGTGDNAKATICFKNTGEKQLLLRFAR